MIYCFQKFSQRISASGWGSTVNTMYATEALILWSKKYKPVSSNHVEVALEVDTNEGKRAIGEKACLRKI